MIYKEEQCKKLCYAIARMRCQGRCEFCGNTAEIHRIFFGLQWMKNWKARYNHLFFIGLCADNHKYEPDAPHIDNDKFFETLTQKLFTKDNDRLVAIMEFKDNPDRNPPKPDWKIIHEKLKNEYQKLEKTNWIDADIDVSPEVKI